MLDLFLTTVLVTASGALSPGPLTAAGILWGSKGGVRSGLGMATGHMLVEAPIVVALGFGLVGFTQNVLVDRIVSLVGGVALLLFGVLHFRSSMLQPAIGSLKLKVGSSSVAVGALFTGLNPFFLTWWLTVGSKLLLDSVSRYTLVGVVLMYASHIWLDYAWLALLAYLAFRAQGVMQSVGYRVLAGVFAVAMLYFGILFLLNGLGKV